MFTLCGAADLWSVLKGLGKVLFVKRKATALAVASVILVATQILLKLLFIAVSLLNP